MASARLFALVGLVALGSLAHTASAPAASSRPVGVRVCTPAAFSSVTKTCSRDQRGEKLVSDTVYCSASGFIAGEATVGFEYEGERQLVGSARTAGRALWWRYRHARLTLPGGDWSCTVSVRNGQRSVAGEAQFESGGPVTTAQGLMACSAINTATSDDGVRLCGRDESRRVIRSPEGVTCNATLVRARGKVLRAQVSYAGRKPIVLGEGRVQYQLTDLGATFTPESFGGDETRLAAGRYTCSFLLGNVVVGSRSVRVG